MFTVPALNRGNKKFPAKIFQIFSRQKSPAAVGVCAQLVLVLVGHLGRALLPVVDDFPPKHEHVGPVLVGGHDGHPQHEYVHVVQQLDEDRVVVLQDHRFHGEREAGPEDGDQGADETPLYYLFGEFLFNTLGWFYFLVDALKCCFKFLFVC